MKLGWLAQLALGLVFGAVFTVDATAAAAAERWLALKDSDLRVGGKGNPLDFSSLVEDGPAGRYGWAIALPNGRIGFENSRKPHRFFGASLVFSVVNGGVPDKNGSEILVDQLRRSGYGLVRLHYIDAHLMTGREGDFDFDPVQLDRLHFLLSRLKAAGIYWIVDGLTSDNAAYGNVKPNRFVKRYQAKLDLLVSDEGFAHWAQLVERLWGAKNPYTGTAPINDPAMLGMILVNEGSVGFLATVGGRVPPALASPFRSWLQKRFVGDESALRSAWGSDLRPGESLQSGVELPERVRGGGRRDLDFARFVVDLERHGFRRMDTHVRKLGYRGLTTAYSNWGFVNADISRSTAGWVDMHAYHALPTNFAQAGSKISQTSVHSNVARYARELTNARQWGKPFTVTEYGQPFWNRWRHESAALIPAIAAHQGWDAICLFAETPIQNDYGPSPFVRRQAIFPYGTGADPITRAGERLAAVLFARGDVAPASGRLLLHIDPERALKRTGGWEQVPEGLSRLALVTASGLDFGAAPTSARPRELSIDLTSDRPQWLSRVESALVSSGVDRLSAGVGVLRDAGIVDAGNRSDPQAKLYQSDTGQLTVDSGNNRILISTERTAVAVLQQGDATAGGLSVRAASGPALFALSTIDGQSLGRSRRMLLWVLTDAINTGMKFGDSDRTTLLELGVFPPTVRTVSATLRFEQEQAGRVRVWPLSLAGNRRAALEANSVGGTVEIKLDTGALEDGPALLFEVTVE